MLVQTVLTFNGRRCDKAAHEPLPVNDILEVKAGCVVGGSQKDINLAKARPSESGSRAPIKLVDGRPWSPNIYRNLRLVGKSLEVAWEKAFVRASHF